MEYIFQACKFLVNRLSKQPGFTTVEYWLVNHPKIHSFAWKQGQTPGSSPVFLTLTVIAYLSVTFLLTRPSFGISCSPRFLRNLTAIHNMILLSLSFTMAVGCTLSILLLLPNVDHLVCFPKKTPPSGPLFFWAYIFYLSKIYEYMDTLLIILSNSVRRLTFLHVYHHATVVVMCYLSLHTSQSMFPGVLVTNAVVHVIMYFYYLLCTLGIRPSWKKLVTDCQIVQFYSSFAIMGWIFYYHFTGSGCSGILGWYFDAVFIASLLVLFLDFHSKNYSKKKAKGN
ncbi:elongation of fatty acids protein sre1-like [Ricinus communis]|uniref:elongation of fatty acids protein sre1-like n=1 Tax=Ricinus communis TaxID=3988 RepID=UPI00201A71D6|nr:elongation of fatty acids protein sre1-like [Ricinus communis]